MAVSDSLATALSARIDYEDTVNDSVSRKVMFFIPTCWCYNGTARSTFTQLGLLNLLIQNINLWKARL